MSIIILGTDIMIKLDISQMLILIFKKLPVEFQMQIILL